MKHHWDNECSKGKTETYPKTYRNYRKRLVSQAWEAVRNDNTPKEKKFFTCLVEISLHCELGDMLFYVWGSELMLRKINYTV